MSFCYLTGVTCEHGSSAHSCLKLIFEQEWKPCEDLAVDQGVLNRLGCALQPIACGVSDGLILCLPLYLGFVACKPPFVINFVDINKVFVEVFVITFVCCDELAVDPWD